MAGIMNLRNYVTIDPADLFGKDAARLLTACEKAFHHKLRPYEGCYRSPSRPRISDSRKNASEGTSFIAFYRAALAKWEKENPEEVQKEQESRKAWEAERDKQHRIIFGIAKRHGIYLQWHGKSSAACCPDQWTIYRKHESIARICCR